jgi:hypothetical protein
MLTSENLNQAKSSRIVLETHKVAHIVNEFVLYL